MAKRMAVVLTAVALAGCGGGPQPSPAASAPAAPAKSLAMTLLAHFDGAALASGGDGHVYHDEPIVLPPESFTLTRRFHASWTYC